MKNEPVNCNVSGKSLCLCVKNNMRLRFIQQELEEYFAKKYTKKYIEFGGYFHIKPYRTMTKSPMQKYFSSGQYKELNDPKLEDYWKAIRHHQFYWNLIGIIVIIIVLIINY